MFLFWPIHLSLHLMPFPLYPGNLLFHAWSPRCQGTSLLHAACDRGHVDLVALLLDAGAPVDVPDNDGSTPLHYGAVAAFHTQLPWSGRAQGGGERRKWRLLGQACRRARMRTDGRRKAGAPGPWGDDVNAPSPFVVALHRLHPVSLPAPSCHDHGSICFRPSHRRASCCSALSPVQLPCVDTRMLCGSCCDAEQTRLRGIMTTRPLLIRQTPQSPLS